MLGVMYARYFCVATRIIHYIFLTDNFLPGFDE